jgi:hypothetical protein
MTSEVTGTDVNFDSPNISWAGSEKREVPNSWGQHVLAVSKPLAWCGVMTKLTCVLFAGGLPSGKTHPLYAEAMRHTRDGL